MQARRPKMIQNIRLPQKRLPRMGGYQVTIGPETVIPTPEVNKSRRARDAIRFDTQLTWTFTLLQEAMETLNEVDYVI